jgi:hypothetical protein
LEPLFELDPPPQAARMSAQAANTAAANTPFRLINGDSFCVSDPA